MSAPNPNWGRWIFASISKHFDTIVADPFTLIMHVEGEHRDTNDLDEWFELRVDGPHSKELSKDFWRLSVEVNCLITTGFDDKNFHRHRLNTDRVGSGFTNCISIYKYGKEVQDDETLLGALRLARNDDTIEQNNFGQIEPHSNLQQSTVEGHYTMELTV